MNDARFHSRWDGRSRRNRSGSTGRFASDRTPPTKEAIEVKVRLALERAEAASRELELALEAAPWDQSVDGVHPL